VRRYVCVTQDIRFSFQIFQPMFNDIADANDADEFVVGNHAAVIAICNHGALAQHEDFAPMVQLILDYLKNSGETCISPEIPGVRSFKACREGVEPVTLTVVTDVLVRDDDGRVGHPCPARLTATPIAEYAAVKMEVSADQCLEKALKSGAFARTFVGIIFELAEWVQRKAKPI
jgi:hypothetical protein